MSLREDIKQDILNSKKSGDSLVVGLLQTVMAEVDRQDKSGNGNISDDKIISIIKKFSKEAKENAGCSKKMGRLCYVDNYEREIATLEKYIPAQMGFDDVYNVLKTSLSKDMNKGQAMKVAMVMLRSKADGRLISSVVDKILSE